MPMMRNPFRKQDENARPINGPSEKESPRIIDTKTPSEFKLSEINDSGVYLPPSPTERTKTYWSSRSATSTTSSNHRSILSPDEPFHISRESFDSYRRSFDISARSPIMQQDSFTRASLDSSRLPPPGHSRSSNSFTRPEPTREEDFEDVGLNDEAAKPVKKRGFFGRFGDENHSTSDHHFHIGGRKRAGSAAQELGEVKGRPASQGR